MAHQKVRLLEFSGWRPQEARQDGNFTSGAASGDKIFDEQTGLAVGPGLRPVPDTSIRINYRRHWVRDLLGNPSPAISGVQVGIATYF